MRTRMTLFMCQMNRLSHRADSFLYLPTYSFIILLKGTICNIDNIERVLQSKVIILESIVSAHHLLLRPKFTRVARLRTLKEEQPRTTLF